jgi:hypothetical protein
MTRFSATVCALSLITGTAGGQLTSTTLLERLDVFPQSWRPDFTYYWHCDLPPCWDWRITDMDDANRVIVLGEVTRSSSGSGFTDQAMAIVEPDGTQIPLVGPYDGLPAESGSISYFDAGFGADGSVLLHYGRRATGFGPWEPRIASLRDGALTVLAEPGTPLATGGTVPTDFYEFAIVGMGTSPVRQAFVGQIDRSGGQNDKEQLYVIDEQGVSLVAESTGFDAGGFRFGRLDVTPRVSRSGVAAVAASDDGDARFVVYDGDEADVRYSFDALNAASDDLDLRWLSGPRGSWDVADDGRIAAIVLAAADGALAERIVEFTPDGPRVLLSAGAAAPGSSGVVLRFDRLRYTATGELIAWVTRDNGAFEKAQIVAFRRDGSPHLVFEGFTSYDGFSTPSVKGFETGSNGVISLDGYVNGGGARLDVMTGVRPPCLADVNGDGLLSPADFNAWIQTFNDATPACDQNGDGLCSPADFHAWILNFNAGC